jgi:hypothetical protein
MTATLTIDGRTFYFGVLPTSGTPDSSVSRQSDQTSLFTGDEAYAVGNAFGEGAMTAVVNFLYPPYTANYSWESPLNYTTAANNTSGGSFTIYHGYWGSSNKLQSAGGYFKVANITVSGPITPPKTPHIFFFDGLKGAVDATETPQSVVVGQQIQLFAVPEIPETPPPTVAVAATSASVGSGSRSRGNSKAAMLKSWAHILRPPRFQALAVIVSQQL